MRTITESNGIYRFVDQVASTQRYTAIIVDENECSEEIDVDASSKSDAREVAKLAIARDYQPGMKISKMIGPRNGLYL